MKGRSALRTICLLLCFALLAGLTPCAFLGGSTASASVDDSPHTISVLVNVYQPLMRVLAKDYMSKHPNITIQLIEDSGVDAYSIAQLASTGAMPDIYYMDVLYNSLINDWAIDLTPYFEKDPNATNYLKSFRDAMTFDGKLYGLSLQALPNFIALNLDMLNEYNVEIPDYDWTIDEYAQLLKDCTKKGYSGGVHVLADLLRYFPAQYNPNVGWMDYDTVNKRFVYDEAWVKSIDVIKDLSDSKVSITESIDQLGREWTITDADEAARVLESRWTWIKDNIGTVEDPWVSSHMASYVCGSWMLYFPENPNFADFEWDLYPIPVANKGDVSRPCLMTEYVGISTACPEEDRQAAYDFLSYLTMDLDAYQIKADYSKNYDQAAVIAENPDLPVDAIAASYDLGFMPPVKEDRAYEIFYSANKELSKMPAFKYAFDNMENAYVDLTRSAIGFNEAYAWVNEVLILDVFAGKRTANDVAQELADVSNQIADEMIAKLIK